MTARATAPNRSKARAPRKPAGSAAPVPQAVPAPRQAVPLPVAPARLAREEPAGAAQDAVSFEIEFPSDLELPLLSFPQAEAGLSELIAMLDDVARRSEAKRTAADRVARRGLVKFAEKLIAGERSAGDTEQARRRIAVLDSKAPASLEEHTIVYAREFAGALGQARSALKAGDAPSAFAVLLSILAAILSPTDHSDSGLVELLKGLENLRSTQAGGRRRRSPRIPPAELAALQLRARAMKKKSPRLSWEAIATRLLPELEKSKQPSVDRFARMLSARTGEDSPAPAS